MGASASRADALRPPQPILAAAGALLSPPFGFQSQPVHAGRPPAPPEVPLRSGMDVLVGARAARPRKRSAAGVLVGARVARLRKRSAAGASFKKATSGRPSLPPPENLVERRELALILRWVNGGRAFLQNGEDERAELALELRLGEDTAELVRHDLARQFVHAASEGA